MFKKLRDKITEEVQQTSLRLPVSVQQLSQLSPFGGSGGENSEPSKSPQNELHDEVLIDISEIQPAGDNKDLFSIDEDSGEGTPNKAHSAFQVVELGDVSLVNDASPENASEQHVNDPFDPSSGTPSASIRKSSEGSSVSEVSGLFPIYEVPGVSLGIPQSDLESCSSEWEDGTASLDHLSKDTVYQGYLRVRQRYHKYKGRYSDIVRAYQEKEKETSKLRDVLTKTQDKAMRRVSELREQCCLEQQAKAHLEQELRSDLEERDHKISALLTKNRLLQEGYSNDVQVKSSITGTSQQEIERHDDELSIPPPLTSAQVEDINAEYSHPNEDGDDVSVGSLGSISTAHTSLETDELIEKLRGDIMKHKVLLSRCMENIRMNKERILSLSQERDQATKKLQETTDSVELLKVDHSKELQSLRANVESSALSMAETKQQLFKEFQAKEVEAELFKQRAAEHENTITSLQEQLEDCKRENADEEQEICIETKLDHSETTSELSLSFRESELKCSELEKLIAELQDTTKNLEIKADELNKKNRSLEEALQNKKNDVHSSDSAKAEEELNRLQEEKSQLDLNYKDKLSELCTAKSECDQLLHQVHNLKANYDQLIAEKENLDDEIVCLSSSQAEKLQLNTEKINEMIKENASISSERDNLLDQLDKISRENTDMSELLSGLQESFDEMKIQNNLSNENNAKLHDESQKNNKITDSLKEELIEKSSSHQRDLRALEESWESKFKETEIHIESIEKENHQLNLKCTSEKEASGKLKKELQTLKHDCDKALTEVGRIAQTMTEKEGESNRVKLLNHTLEDNLTSLEVSNQKSLGLLKSIKDKIIPYCQNTSIDDGDMSYLIESHLSDKFGLEKKVRDLEESIKDHDTKAKQMEDQLLQSFSEQEKFMTLSSENDKLTTSLKDAEEEVRAKSVLLKEEGEKLVKITQDMKVAVTNAEKESASLKQQLLSLQGKLDACQAKLDDAARNADYLQKINAKMKTSAQEREEKLNLLKESCFTKEDNIKILEDKIVHLVAEKKNIIDEFNSKIADLEKILNERLEEMKKARKDLEAQVEDAEKKFASKEKKMMALMNNLSNEKTALQGKLTSIQDEKATLHTVIEQNEAFISTLKVEHAQKVSDVKECMSHEWSLKLEELQGEHVVTLASTKTALVAEKLEARAQFESECARLCRLLEERDESLLQLREDSAVHLTTTMDQQAQQHQGEIERLKELLSEREGQLETQVQDMEVSNADMRQRIESLQTEISQLENNYKDDFSQAERRHNEERATMQSRLESEKRSLEERLTADKVVMQEQLTADKVALEDVLERERSNVESETNSEIQSLSEKLKSMDLAHKALIDKIEQVEAKNGEMNRHLHSLQNERDEAKKLLEGAHNEKQDLLSKESKFSEVTHNLENQVKLFKAENDRVSTEMEKYKELFSTERQVLQEDALRTKAALQQNEESSTQAKSVIASLSEQVEALKAEQTNFLVLIQELQANCSETTSKLNATDQEKNQLKRNLDELTASRNGSGTDEAKVQDKLLELDGQIKTLKSENAHLLEDLEKGKDICSPEKAAKPPNEENLRLSEELEQLRRSSERAVVEEKTIMATLRVECNFFKGEIERVRQSLISEKSLSESLEQENSQLMKEKDTLKSPNSEKEKIEEISSLSSKVKLLNEENVCFKNKIEQLVMKLEETTSKLVSIETEKEEKGKLLERLNSEKEEWSGEKSKLTEMNTNLDHSLHKIQHETLILSDELNSSNQEASILKEQVTTLTNNITNLQKQIECLIQTSNHSASELASTQNRCSHLEEELKQLSASRDDLQKQLQEANAHHTSLSSQNSELSSKLEALSGDAQLGERVPILEKQLADLQSAETALIASVEASKAEEASLRSSVSSLEETLREERSKRSELDEVLRDLRSTCRTVCSSLAEREGSNYFKDVLLALSRQRDEITKQLSEELISKEQLACQLRQEADKFGQIRSSLNDKAKEIESINSKLLDYEERSRLLSLEREEAIQKSIAERSASEETFKQTIKKNESLLSTKHDEELTRLAKDHRAKLKEAECLCTAKVGDAVKKKEGELQQRMDQLTDEWNQERKHLERLTQVAAAAFKTGTDSVDLLKKQVSSQRKEIDEMNNGHRKEVSELQALLEVKRRRSKPSSAGGDIHLAGALEDSAEFDYLRNILFEYMLGKETQILCKVLCAVVKFDTNQQQQILEHEERKQNLKRLEAVRQSDNIAGDQTDLSCLR